MEKLAFFFILILSLISCSCFSGVDTTDSVVSQMSVQDLKILQNSDENFYLFEVR